MQLCTCAESWLLLADLTRLLIKNPNYESDIYTPPLSTYYPLVVWQFWGRAAGAS
jgi:hypothetical protein